MNYRLRFSILKRDEFTCRYCGQKAPNVILHVDHVRAKANGGDDDPSNLVTACSACNLGKADAIDIDPMLQETWSIWRQIVWEWIGAFGHASIESLPDRDETFFHIRRYGQSAVDAVQVVYERFRESENLDPRKEFLRVLRLGLPPEYRGDVR